MSDVPHYCSSCGEVHGGSSRESEELRIAKINADRDIRIAEIQRSEVKREAEAAEQIAGTEAEAAVDTAVVQAAAIVETGVVPEPEPEIPVVEPPVVIADAGNDGQEEPPAPPEIGPPPTEPKGKGIWASYR